MDSTTFKVDLTNCDREPIHIPGSIQPHGAMLVCEASTGTILHASANAADFISTANNNLVGLTLDEAIGDKGAHDLRNAIAKSGSGHGALLAYSPPQTATIFNITIHQNDDLHFVEFEHASPREDARAALDVTQSITRRIGLETEVDKIAGAGAKLIRAMLGYDRVMVYRFLYNGAGRVIAEAKRPNLQSFLGQHFPASDIPIQARRLYLLNWIRMIGDIDYTPVPLVPVVSGNARPIDMSFAHLRSVSPIHCEYLRNMGVRASMSISIVIDGVLWGLIACHHDDPKHVPMPMRLGAELIGQYFSLQIALAERRTEFVAASVARERLDSLIKAFTPDRPIGESTIANLDGFAELIDCDGVGAWIDGVWAGNGTTPERADLPAIIQLVADHTSGSIWHVHELQRFMDGAIFRDQVAGLLAVPIGSSRDFLLFFRSEEAHELEWAGEPAKKVVMGLSGDRLTPRGSFETWREDVRGQCKPWVASELAVAEAIRAYIRDVALRHNEVTAEERSRDEERRRVVNDELNHRVKNIITLVKSIAAQTGATAKSVLDYSSLLEGRLRALAFAHDQSLGDSGGDLKVLLEAEATLHRDEATSDRVLIEGPAIGLNDRAFGVIALLMHEMITNAAKYGALSVPEGQLTISWSITDTGDCAIAWQECGGPAVVRPVTTGFGTKLIQSTISYDLGGSAEINYAPAGLQGRFLVPGRHLKEIQPTAPKAEIAAVKANRDLSGLKVMLVEDHALIAIDTEALLRQLGALDVVMYPGSAEALASLAIDTPDCVILDFNLGDETSAAVADDLVSRAIPFVFATGYGDSVMIPERFADVPIVRKPASGAVLAETLTRILLPPHQPE